MGEQLTVGGLIDLLSKLDRSLPVYHESETGPEPSLHVSKTPIVWIRHGEDGDGVVIGNQMDASYLARWVKDQRKEHDVYRKSS